MKTNRGVCQSRFHFDYIVIAYQTRLRFKIQICLQHYSVVIALTRLSRESF